MPGASPDSLDRLKASSPVALPDSYLAFLASSNGGEGPLPISPLYLILDGADEVAAALGSGVHEEFFPGFLMIGSNGGGSYIAFDIRGAAPWPVVDIDMTNIDLDESVRHVASSFDDFEKLFGLDEAP